MKFYQTESGRAPVEEFILKQPGDTMVLLLNDLRALCSEYPNVKTVDIKHLRGKLWEIKERIEKKNYRIIYAVVGPDLVIVHGFIKKKGRINDEIKIAEQRLKDFYQNLKRERTGR
jgi:phage-related protein